jgi:hypothetical protein
MLQRWGFILRFQAHHYKAIFTKIMVKFALCQKLATGRVDNKIMRKLYERRAS